MHIQTLDTTILIIVAVFAAFCFWKWIKCKAEAKACRRVSALLMKEVSYFSEKARHDGPKVIAEDPAPNKALQARIEPAPGSALQVHVPKDLADPRNADELKIQAGKTWDAQHKYRRKMHARGFVRAIGDDGHSHWYPMDKTAWIKTSKKWSRVPIASKAFRGALAYFPGTDPKPTKDRLVKLASELGTKMELMNDAKRNEARRRSA